MRSLLAYLGFIYTFYLLCGGVVFYLLENVHVIPVSKYFPNVTLEYDHMISYLLEAGFKKADIDMFFEKYESLTPLNSPYQKIMTPTPSWDFDNSFFFSLGLITTIGYGNVSPTTIAGKVFCLFFLVLGVPLNMVFIHSIAELHSERWQSLICDPAVDAIDSKFMRHVFIFQDMLYSLGGVIFIPTIILMYSESWTFLEGLYYGIITLSTIGFGDYIAGSKLDKALPSTMMYKAFLFIWFLIGISYLSMVFSYMAHYNMMHYTYALVCRNKKPGLIRIHFPLMKMNYHQALYAIEFEDTTESEQPTTEPEFLSSVRGVEDLDFMINRMIRERRIKLDELQKKRRQLKLWKSSHRKKHIL